MSRPIVLYPDPILKKKSQAITKFTEDLAALAAEMTESMREANGVGLAAVQIGELLRMMVMDENYDKEEKGETLVLINPVVLEEQGTDLSEEGCLSIPDVREEVERALKVKVKAQDLKGEEHTYSFEGLLARCILHEIDHMNGQLFIQRISAVKKLFHQKQLHQLKKNFEKAPVRL